MTQDLRPRRTDLPDPTEVPPPPAPAAPDDDIDRTQFIGLHRHGEPATPRPERTARGGWRVVLPWTWRRR